MKKRLLLLPLLACSLISCGQKQKIENNYSIHTELQKLYLDSPYANVPSEANGEKELSKPLPIHLEWDVASYPSYTLDLVDEKDPSYTRSFSEESPSFSILNLRAGSSYSYVLSGVSNETSVLKEGTFSIEDEYLTNYDVDGVTNVRDLGGYTTLDGKKIKQGLLFRSGNLDQITEEGCGLFQDLFHLKTEIDLRLESDGILGYSPVKNVEFHSLPMISSGSKNMLDLDAPAYASTQENIKAFFSLLAEEDNYPIDFHCAIGTDRTGAMAFLINGFLGVDLEYLHRDFLFSNFGLIGSSRNTRYIDRYCFYLEDNFPAETLSEQIHQYLLALGVSETELNQLKAILLEA